MFWYDQFFFWFYAVPFFYLYLFSFVASLATDVYVDVIIVISFILTALFFYDCFFSFVFFFNPSASIYFLPPFPPFPQLVVFLVFDVCVYFYCVVCVFDFFLCFCICVFILSIVSLYEVVSSCFYFFFFFNDFSFSWYYDLWVLDAFPTRRCSVLVQVLRISRVPLCCLP